MNWMTDPALALALTDPDIDCFERDIPKHARLATKRAYQDALESGHAVTVTVGNVIYRVEPDGSRRKVKDAAPRTRVRKGHKLRLP